MCVGSDDLPEPVEDYEKSMHLVNGGTFRVKDGLRYREEPGFWLVHIVGAWIAKVNPEVGRFLMEQAQKSREFTANDFPEGKEELADLLTKAILEKVGE